MQASERGGQRHEIAHWACATGPGAHVRERPLGGRQDSLAVAAVARGSTRLNCGQWHVETAIRLADVRDYNIAMNSPYKRLTFGICIIILGTAGSVRAGASRSMHWTKIPSITVVSAAADSRIEAVREAIAFWNRTFADLGTPFRFGEPTFVTGTIPDDDIQSLGNQVLHDTLWPTTPGSLERVPGDLLIILSDAQFISYTAYRGDRVIVAIKNGGTPPLTLPNVLQNLIAHELGHAVGLEHNQDPALLMCGRPAACRPDAFEAPLPRFFPLSDGERNRLLTLYPRKWAVQSHN